MAWFAVVEKGTNRLASLGTVVGTVDPGLYDVIDIGETKPDLTTTQWDAATRSFVARPAPVLVDRVADVRAWVTTDADYLALTTANRNRVNNILGRLVPRLLGPYRMRVDVETPELTT